MKKNEVSWFKLYKSDFDEIECGEEDFIYYKLSITDIKDSK